MPTAISLFTGCGGSDAGVISAGFDVIMANDILPYAREVYLTNLPETDYLLGDVSSIQSFPKADLLVGCYPCQGFSQGGARLADRKVNTLYVEFARALEEIQPKAFIAENVSGLRRSTYRHLLDDQLKRFSEAGENGYQVYWQQVNAHEYGVAQERKRVVIVGIRKDLDAPFSFPKATHGPEADKPYFTIGEALQGLPDWPVGEFCEDVFHWYYLSRNRRRDWNQISKTIVSHMRHMPLHPISPPLIRIHTDKWEFADERPARRFSFREAARLQGFYSRFMRHGEDMIFPERPVGIQEDRMNILRHRFRVVGNAVPPPMFEAIAGALPDVW